ncbi:MAG: FtsW/RodA/SpoVE family cell cycle protein, partial [Chloroflexi bacterium]|nr:FtsW/RodA/SpoVE family cell cycle protein [Chloroflexota bacterium]
WLVAAGVAALLLPALLQVPRVQQRWNAWLWPHHAPLGYGYQPLAAARALERGGWWGQGLAAGQPEQVPLSATDFIFVAWGEEGGWGMLALLVALEALVWLGLGRQTCRLAAPWPQSLGMAVTAYGAHLTAWVMAGNLRLVPLSGLPLPWVAHGGAALLTLSALVAVLTAQPLAEPSTSCPRVWRGHLYAWGALYALVLARAALLAG